MKTVNDLVKELDDYDKESLCYILNQLDNDHEWTYSETPCKADYYEIDDFTIYKDGITIVEWLAYEGYYFNNTNRLTNEEAFILLRWLDENDNPFFTEDKTIDILESGEEVEKY